MAKRLRKQPEHLLHFLYVGGFHVTKEVGGKKATSCSDQADASGSTGQKAVRRRIRS